MADKKKTTKSKTKKTKDQVPVSLGEESIDAVLDVINMFAGSPRRKKKKGKPGLWKVKQVDDHEWVFDEPPDVYDAYAPFDAGCNLLDVGNVEKAEKLLAKVVTNVPTHMDALHHLAIIYEGTGRHDEAMDLWSKAVEVGKQALPKSFSSEDRLEWGWIENRPFLRSQHGLATTLLHDGKIKEAQVLFEEMLSFNPHDNQGVREVLLAIYLGQGELKNALALCKQYPDDMLAGLYYGYPLVLFKLGKQAQASKTLQKVVKQSPKIAQELLKKTHRPPTKNISGYISIGGWDEAYEYWAVFGEFWDTEALEWLKKETR